MPRAGVACSRESLDEALNRMTTPLEKSLKRELTLDGVAYTLVISPDGLHIAPKGKRRGVELRWVDLVSGEAALAVALNASLQNINRFPPRDPARNEDAAAAKVAPTTSATRQAPREAPAEEVVSRAQSSRTPVPRKTANKSSGRSAKR